MQWYQYTKTQLEQILKTDFKSGLSQKEAQDRFLQYGPNLLPDKKLDSWTAIFFRQFKSPLIYALLVAATIVYFIGDHADSVIILVVLTFNAIIGAVQEGKSERTLESLKKLSQAESEVLRGGTEMILPEREVVPGDILILQEGQKVTADARVIFSSNLSVDESAMTGETGGVHKYDGVLSDEGLPPASQHNMVFKGTSVLSGNGRGVVVGTGLNTEIGKISKALLAPETEIPLQREIKKLSRAIIYTIGFISALLFFLGIAGGREVKEMFAVVVSLAVSLIPEGLPLVLTLILVTGVWRMSRRNALVKRLQAVEALGQAGVLAVDKTGTVTRNEMVVKKVYVSGRIYTVTGDGYKPQGAIQLAGQPVEPMADLELAASIATLSSRASVRFQKEEGIYKVAGDPTEAAMLVFGEKLQYFRDNLLKDYKEIAEIPFDYKTKFRAIFYEHKNDVFCAIVGAPEVLLKESTKFLELGQAKALTLPVKQSFEDVFSEFSAAGLRVVAFGFKRLPKEHLKDPFEELKKGSISDMVLGGFYGIEDSIRKEAASAIKRAQEAGIKVVMITGDHKITAKAIAKEVGIFSDGDEIITGNDLAELSAEELSKRLHLVSVFARVTPQDKIKIIEAYKHKGLIVAMTGDGVNDAPSLVGADLGVAMGKIGTEVAKEAGDIVLLDDNLASIVAAIEEGRMMYKNIQKALLYLFSTSLGELLTITLALLWHLPMPLLAVQILWLNLVTDPFIGIALALENKTDGLLKRVPHQRPAYLIDFNMLSQMFLIGLAMAIGTLYLFNLYYHIDYGKSLTISLTTLAVFQWYNGLNCRFPNRSVFNRHFFGNGFFWLAIAFNVSLQLLAVYSPWFQKILRTQGLTFQEWVVVLGIAFLVILVEEVYKLVARFVGRLVEKRKYQAAGAP